jgi:uncharacterized protein YyaL (SSP411 family)
VQGLGLRRARGRWIAGFFVAIGFALLASPACGALTNRLAAHPSPYLALHGDDPVAWQTWDAETVARARRENKLLYVSVGYFACHWCHVMQRESYRDPRIAALLNRDFIPIKVDRELNSGLDEALQQFSARLNGVAGWPLNAFVTPDGYPVFAVLYVPPDDFRDTLKRLAARWQADAAAIRRLAQQAAPPPVQPETVRLTAAGQAQRWEAFMRGVWQEADLLHGGFGEVSKFPMAPQLDALLDRQRARPDPKLAEFLKLSFDQMAARGLRDHIGGGFFRYTVDPGWETPHFEKMLYDNAHLARLYLRAAEALRQPRYEAVARGALDFMRGVLGGPDGGLYASTSAVDAAGREGATYLWEPEALRRALPPDVWAAASRVWRLDAPRHFEDGYLPAEYRVPTPGERRLLDEAVRVLRPLRAVRSLPVDDKQNAGLNGLALSAFSRAAGLDPGYRRTADQIQGFLLKRMLRGDRLVKAVARGKALPDAELEDYAYVVEGLLDHAEATGNHDSREAAVRLARSAWRLFWSERGWRHEARPLLATIAPEPALRDGALYSPSDVLIRASLRTGDAALTARARQARAWRVPEMARDPYAWPSRLRLLDWAAAPLS